MQKKARPSSIPGWESGIRLLGKVALAKSASPMGVALGEARMGPLGHLQVDLGRLVVGDAGGRPISPLVRVADLVEPLRQGNQHYNGLARQQVLEKRVASGAGHHTPKIRNVGTDLLAHHVICGLEILPARIENTGRA